MDHLRLEPKEIHGSGMGEHISYQAGMRYGSESSSSYQHQKGMGSDGEQVRERDKQRKVNSLVHRAWIVANAASGMAVDDECKLKFMDLKAKRTHRFIIYKIEEKQKQVMVEKVGEPAQTYDDFTACLPENECRYCVFDYDFLTPEGVQKSRIFFIAWSPDTARVRNKMIYASSKDRFKRELDGIQVELQATDPTEMGLDVIQSRAY
ncbi:hypothetical protein SSX86_020455 [Deinandra increscens subsp. villosa]|uniref:ADF-H domain-containing protein n=1 Tax=Deinandra increscens subsp. villosa TaxID=3103831 RepID=A0AAP0CPB7_9ASTR